MADRPLKVLRIITRLNVGGPSFHVRALKERLCEPEVSHRVLFGMPAEGEAEAPFAATVGDRRIETLVRGIRPFDDRSAYRAILEEIRAFGPDIVHTHLSKAGVLGRIAARKLGVRGIVHTFHGHVFEGYFGPLISRAVAMVERRLLRSSHRLIAQSESQRADLVRHLGDAALSKIRVVEPAVDFARLGPARVADIPETPTLAFVGRFAPVKRLDVFLWIVKAVRERLGVRVRAIIAGGGSEAETRRLDSLAELWGIAGDVRRLGPAADPAEALRQSHCLCMTSRMEGTPLAVIEALALGVPVVAFDVGGIRDVVRDARIARLVPFDDAPMMVEEIVRCIQKPPELPERESAAALVRRRFGVERLAADLLRIYREITCPS